MKLFIAALITFALVIGVCLWGTLVANEKIDALLTKLATQTDDGIPADAEAVSNELLTAWDKDFFVISMFLPHHHLDEVKEQLTSLSAYAKSGEEAAWLEAKMLAEESLRHIRGLMNVNFDNIL